jgi:hypothetical protein
MAGVLNAIQNGAIFRDMSNAAVLGGVLQTLAGVAERTAIGAGQLSGDALAAALQSAGQLANTVAQGVQQLAGSSFDSLTRLGAEANRPSAVPVQQDGQDPNPLPDLTTLQEPTPPPGPPPPRPRPRPTPDDTQTNDTDRIELVFRVFVPSEAWVPPLGTTLSGLGPLEMAAALALRFSGHGEDRAFSVDQGEGYIDLKSVITMKRDGMEVVDQRYVRRTISPGQIYTRLQTSAVSGRPSWFEAIDSGETPIFTCDPVGITDSNLAMTAAATGSTIRLSVKLDAAPYESVDLANVPDIDIDVVVVSFKLRDALQFLLEFVPNMNADITVTLSKSADGVLLWETGGRHDSFPAYELYLIGEVLHTHDPVPDSTPFGLRAETVALPSRTGVVRTLP